MSPRKDPYTRLGIEPLEQRNMMDGTGIHFDPEAFVRMDDPSRNQVTAEYRILAEQAGAYAEQTQHSLQTILGEIGRNDGEINQYQQEADGLLTTLSSLQMQEDTQEGSISALREQRDAAGSQLSAVRLQDASLVQSIMDERTTIATLTAQSNEHLQQVTSLKEQENGLLGQNANITTSLNVIETKIQATLNALVQADTDLQTISQQLLDAEEQKTNTQQTIDNIDAALLRVADEQETLLLQKREAETEVQGRTDSVATAREAEFAASDALTKANTTTLSAQAALTKAEQDVTTQQQTVASLESKLTSLQSQKTTLTVTLTALEKQKPRDPKAEKAVKEQITKVNAEISTTTTQLNAAKTVLAQYIAVRDQARKTYDTAVAAENLARVRQLNATNDLTVAQNALMIAQSNLQTITSALATNALTCTELTSSRTTATNAFSAIAQRTLDLARTRTVTEQAATELNISLSSQTAERTELRAQQTDVRRLLASLATDIASLQASMDAVCNLLATHMAALSQLETAHALLAAQSNDLAAHIAIMEGQLSSHNAVLDAVFAEYGRTWGLYGAVLSAKDVEIAEGTALNTSLTQTKAAADAALSAKILAEGTCKLASDIDALLDVHEAESRKAQERSETALRTIQSVKTQMQEEEAAGMQEALQTKQTALENRKHDLTSQIAGIDATKPFAEAPMVTPSIVARMTGPDSTSVVVEAKDFPAGIRVSIYNGQNGWSQVMPEGTSNTSVSASVFNHDGKGGAEVIMRVASPTGGELAAFSFWMSGSRFLGDARSYSGSFASLAHPQADPIAAARGKEMSDLLLELAKTETELQDTTSGILASLDTEDPRIAQSYLTLRQAAVMRHRDLTGDPPPALVQSRSLLTADETLQRTTDNLLSPDQQTSARSRGSSVFLVHPTTQQILTEVPLNGLTLRDMAWSSDGTKLACIASPSAGLTQVGIFNIATGTMEWFTLSSNDCGAAVIIAEDGTVVAGMQSGTLRFIVERDGTLQLLQDSLQDRPIVDLHLTADGTVQVLTGAERIDLLIDGTRGSVESGALSTLQTTLYSGARARFEYQHLGMVNNTGLGQQQMAEKTGEAIADKLYTYADVDRFVAQLYPEFYGTTGAEVDAKLHAWADAHGVNYDFARGERLKAYQRIEEGIDMFNGIMKEHYVRAFWVVHDLLTAIDKSGALQQKNEIDYGAGGGQILAPIWTPALPTMKTIFYDVYNRAFDAIYNAAQGVNDVQSIYWAWRADANVGATEAGNNEGSSTQRQISERLVSKINAVVASSGGSSSGHVIVAGRTYSVEALQRASSMEPSTYVATATRYNPFEKDPEDLDQRDVAIMLDADALGTRLLSMRVDDPMLQQIIDDLASDPDTLAQLIGTTDRHIWEDIIASRTNYAMNDVYFDVDNLLLQPYGTAEFPLSFLVENEDQTAPVPGMENQSFILSHQTMAGKLFAWTLREAANPSEGSNLAKNLAGMTGIPLARVLTALSPTDLRQRAQSLHELFAIAGYGDAFVLRTDSEWPTFTNVSLRFEKTVYTAEDVTVRFNISPGQKKISHIFAYLEYSDTDLKTKESVPFNTNGQLSYTFSPADFAKTGHYQVKLVCWLTDGSHVAEKSESFIYEKNGITGDYSTNLDREHAMIENKVLSFLADKDVFPLRNLKAEGWNWNIASPFHDGPALNAIDLTIAGSGDHGKPVYAPAEGKVIAAGTDGTHTIILEHRLPSGEVWYSKHMHMEQIGLRNGDGTIRSLQIGDIVPANSIFGLVSDIGSSGQYHWHGEFMLTANGPAIDMRKVLTEVYNISVFAEDAGADGSQVEYGDNQRLQVQWDTNINAWVTSDTNPTNPHLILDRSAQAGAENVATANSNQFWIANHADPSQRARVVFIQDDISGFKGWVKISNDGSFARNEKGNILIWNGFEFIAK